MKKVVLGAPCVKLYHLLQKLLESAERSTLVPDRYFVVDNGCGLPAKMATGEIKLPDKTIVASPGRHVGVSGAWNMIFRENPDFHVIISNDDVEMHEKTIESLVRAADEHEEAEFLYPSYQPGAMFCVFLMKHRVLDKIGGFDEGFHPAYFEDNDFHRRMKLGGIVEMQVDGASYDHVGSATLKSYNDQEMREHHDAFERNKRRYIQKWGNVPGLEAYDKGQC